MASPKQLNKTVTSPDSSWYALRVRGGKEEKIKESIEKVFAKTAFENALKRIYIPFQRMYDIRKGKREIKKHYFAYLIVQIDLSDDTRKQLMGIDGVMGFVTPTGFGREKTAIPLTQLEVDNMLGKAATHEDIKGSLDDTIHQGDQIEIIDGAFQGHKATVQKADKQSKKIEVLVRIFKKDTTLELNYNQVKKK